MIYLIFDSLWVSMVYVVPKKRGMAIIINENNELIPTRTVIGWQMCIDYKRLNQEKLLFSIAFDGAHIREINRSNLLLFLGCIFKI